MLLRNLRCIDLNLQLLSFWFHLQNLEGIWFINDRFFRPIGHIDQLRLINLCFDILILNPTFRHRILLKLLDFFNWVIKFKLWYELYLRKNIGLEVDRDQRFGCQLWSFVGNQLLKDVIHHQDIVFDRNYKLSVLKVHSHVHEHLASVNQPFGIFSLLDFALFVLLIYFCLLILRKCLVIEVV